MFTNPITYTSMVVSGGFFQQHSKIRNMTIDSVVLGVLLLIYFSAFGYAIIKEFNKKF